MLNPATITNLIGAILSLATLPAPTSAWYMQQATTQNVALYKDGRRLGTEPSYLSQSSDEPLTFESCITINWGNLNDNSKINFFSFSRDIPQWDDNKTHAENLLNVVRGIVFFEGSNCEPLTTRIIFRLDDDYKPGSFLFLTSKPVVPPLRLGSWRPMWLYGQGGYSHSLSQIEVGGSRLFPPPLQLQQMVREQFPVMNQQLQQQLQQQATVINREEQQQNQVPINPELQTQLHQQQQADVIPTLPNTRQRTRNRGNQNPPNQIRQLQQGNADPDPREELGFDEVIRENLLIEEGEGEGESPRQLRLQQLTNQVENLQRMVDTMSAERQNVQSNIPVAIDHIFEEEKEDYIEASISDISNFFRMNNDQDYDENFGLLQRSNSGAPYFVGNVPSLFSREGSNFREIFEENPAENQQDIAQEEQPRLVVEQQGSRIVEEPVEANQQEAPESTAQRPATESNPKSLHQIIDEVPQSQRSWSQARSQVSTQLQENQRTVNNQPSGNQIEMPPPNRPSRQQPQGIFPSTIGLQLENNRLRYAQAVNSKFNPYLETMTKILAGTGQLIQDTVILLAQDANIDNTDQYLAEIERIINQRKEYMALNEDKFLEAVRNAGARLTADNTAALSALSRNIQQNAGQQAGEQQTGERQYGSLNGGLKREDV
ncbi:hypothetical protein TWF481_000025 [Arthrobotrys musiformis]|uniref:Uncharacterized protein n=1 Tax=Arthrobotrys musiformis TaxID=47236 RepID=A0AAV9WLS0_9PEZI